MKKSLRILFTCIGRRVTLLQYFRVAAHSLGIKAVFMGTDTSPLAAALQLCDKKFVLPPVNSPGYMRSLMKIVKAEKIDLIIPTIDPELEILAKNRDKLAKIGAAVLVSDAGVINMCRDKRKMHDFFTSNDFDTPKICTPKAALAAKRIKFPLFLKPWDGSAAKANAVVKNREELEFYSKHIPHCMVQEFIKGTEYTCDVYVDSDMKVRCVVPRKRIEVRGGEVSKGQTVKHAHIMETTAKLVEKLGAGPGVITVQCFLTDDGKLKFMEINPRFGGGVILAITAGADFPKWILSELIGKKPDIKFNAFQDGLIMLRYDEQVFLLQKN